jgi:hypothetical protein
MKRMTFEGQLPVDPEQMQKAMLKADASAEGHKAWYGVDLTREQVSLLYMFYLAFPAGWIEVKTNHGLVLVPFPPRKDA